MSTRAQAKVIEGIVARLEQAIGRKCIVSQNVTLREKVTGNPRECDVVVVAGEKPREFRAIIEVQKRGRKVDSAQLDSWVRKAHKLGVNKLVCVSAKGYTKPVIKSAAVEGDFVSLYELKAIDALNPPEGLPSLQMRFQLEPVWSLIAIHLDGVIGTPRDGSQSKKCSMQIRHEERILQIENYPEPRCIFDLMELFAWPISTELFSYFLEVTSGTIDVLEEDVRQIYLNVPEGKLVLRQLKMDFVIERGTREPDRIEILQYIEVNSALPAGYVVTPILESRQQTPFKVDLAIAPRSPSGQHAMIVLPPNMRPPIAKRRTDAFGLRTKLSSTGPVFRANVTFRYDENVPVSRDGPTEREVWTRIEPPKN
ncbi:MAG: hypothetical protein IT462_05985 [Planctomycetes bacterium]|nr:hypothetical protein [Planctomycetota bacterium]